MSKRSKLVSELYRSMNSYNSAMILGGMSGTKWRISNVERWRKRSVSWAFKGNIIDDK